MYTVASMACSIPDFINDIPTIEPLPAFPIVCATSFPPALTIPDIPLPPCIDGLSFTSSGINVTVNQGTGYLTTASATSSFNITEGPCSFDFGGTITINLPSVVRAIDGINGLNGLDGAPGPQGPGAGCNAPCVGYYS